MLGSVLGSLELVNPRSLKQLVQPLQRLIRNRLWLQVLVGMALGIAAGLLINPDAGFVSKPVAHAIGEWLALPGHLFLAFIQMIVVPLVLASIIRGIAAATDIQQLRSTGLGLAVYFVVTTAAAAVMGIVIGLTIRPGDYVDPSVMRRAVVEMPAETEDVVEQVPDNKPPKLEEIPERITEVLPTNPMSSIVEGEMLQIVIFSIVIGIGLLSVPVVSAKPLLELLGSVQQVCMAIVGVVMTFAPVAVFGLLAQAMINAGAGVLTGLGMYAAVVVLGMAVLLVFYVALAVALGNRNPVAFLKGIREPLLLGFSTNSSAATMPVTVKAAEEDLGVRPSLAQLIVPLGATMNMGGTALYQCLATMFMAQLFQLDLPLGVLIALVFTAVGASIGTPAVPGVGIIVLATVLSSAGVPLAGLSLIIGLDRILERFRTSLNVAGDLVACVVMDRFTSSKTSREAERAKAEAVEADRYTSTQDVVV
jgi:Na+/H+-dicarboxylate symporter